jgi:hypothetical protein
MRLKNLNSELTKIIEANVLFADFSLPRAPRASPTAASAACLFLNLVDSVFS